MKSKYLEFVFLLVLFSGIIARDIVITHYDMNKQICNLKDFTNKLELEDYHNLLDQLDLDTPKQKNITARVINRNINDFYEYITINKGKKHNISKHDIVVNKDGLVGIVKKTYQNKSLVMLVSNKSFSLSVRILNSYGTLKSINGKLIIEDLTRDCVCNKGDIVYTSGLTNIPKNIVVGVVKDITFDPSGVKKKVLIQSTINDKDLNYVSILEGEI